MFFYFLWFLLKNMDWSNSDSKKNISNDTLEVILFNFPFKFIDLLMISFGVVNWLFNAHGIGLIWVLVIVVFRFEELKVAANKLSIQDLVQ